MDTHDLLAPSVSAFESSSNIISEPYNWDIVGRPKESKVKLISNKPLANFSTFSHGIRVQLLVENLEKNRFLAHLACRFREKSATCLAFELVLEQGSLQYRRNSPIGLREVILDNYLHYKLTVKDVYIAQPRQDFTLSLRPVRYQIESSSILPTPETSLYLMEDAVYKAGFTPVTYSPPVEYWARPGSVPHIRLSPELRLWNHDKDSAVVYRNEETGDSFAVIIATSQKFRSKPQRFLVGLVDNISPDTSGDAVVDEFFKDKSHLLTDLSTQMLVKLLRSGKQVILSVNVVREQADTFTAVALQNFRLWIVVKEPRM
jgi:hypothetical protein